MTIGQMQSLGGSSHLHSTAKRVLGRCGLPVAITEEAGPADKRSVSWRGVAMRLSAMDWRIAYGPAPQGAGRAGWINPKPTSRDCLSGLAWLVLHAKGRVGAVTVAEKPDGSGYVTSYRVPSSLFEAHKVIGLDAGLSERIPASILAARFGPPDELLAIPGGKERHRYWILTRGNERPDSLHAVDFEIDNTDRRCGAYRISAMGTDFVDEKLESLLRAWERAYVLD